MEHRPESLEQRRSPGHQPGIQQREQELGVVDLEVGELVDLTDLMTNHDPEIPQWVQERAEESFL